MISAMINPTIAHVDHTPPNQCSTTVYQSSDVGKKMKPRIGHSDDVNKPSNHVVSTQSSTIATRRASSAFDPASRAHYITLPPDQRGIMAEPWVSRAYAKARGRR